MSSPGTTPSTSFVDVANQTVLALAPLAAIADPSAAAAIELGAKIIQGVLTAAPEAIALFQQIQNGTPATMDQLNQDFAVYDASDDKLAADISAKIGS